MDWPEVTLVLITWNRPEIIRRTLDSLVEHLSYPNLRLHVADDGTGGTYVRDILRDYDGKFERLSSSVTDRKGWGANANRALNEVSNLVYQQEDDYILSRPLDLRLGVLLLRTVKNVGCVRYRGITGHRILAHLREFKTGPEFRQALSWPGKIDYWELSKKSPELYVYSHGPHLKAVKRFHGKYGWYVEGRKLGYTEEEFAHRVKDGSYPIRVAIFPEWVPQAFDHIGKTFKLTKEDVGK